MLSRFAHRLWTLSPEKLFRWIAPGPFQNRREYSGASIFTLDAAESNKVADMPRFTPFVVKVGGHGFQVIDSESFAKMVDEIFVSRAYEFEARRKCPVIVDCGANIGVSVAFFKTLYPCGRVVAYEADPYVYAALESNIRALGYAGVDLHNKAVWNQIETLPFQSEGSWGGRLSHFGVDRGQGIEVHTIRFRDALLRLIDDHDWIDFLKVDIEGAEYEVMSDIADLLHNVDHLFLEYHSFRRREQRLDELLRILANAGLRYYIKEASRISSPFLQTIGGQMDLQLDIFAHRSLRGLKPPDRER